MKDIFTKPILMVCLVRVVTKRLLFAADSDRKNRWRRSEKKVKKIFCFLLTKDKMRVIM